MNLLISNVGVAPIEGYTLLGMSTTRDCGVEGAIGQFGSGTKHAINVLLRAGIKFTIYCGLTRLEFSTREEEVNDGLGTTTVQKVICKLGGTSTRTIDCGWCLDFGSTDWIKIAMGLREFVSNAIDRTIRETGGFKEALTLGALKVVTVEENQIRARDGHTQVFVELTPEVQQYFGELPKRFLHFSANPDQVYQTILPKADRNLHRDTPMIYRCGVLVREIEESRHPSLFDYNFDQKQIKIDEARNSSEYYVRAACAKVMRKADQDTLAAVYESLIEKKSTFESFLDVSYLCPSWETPNDEEKAVWSAAWQQASKGDSAVLCKEEETHAAKCVARKGYEVKVVTQSAWVDTAKKFGVSTAGDILTESEQKGREMLPPTQSAQNAVDTVWGWIYDMGIRGKGKPKVACYREMTDTESTIMGFWEEGSDTVHLRDDIGLATTGVQLETALEMVVYYLTRSMDNSRDVQQFLLTTVVEMAAAPVN